MSSPITQFIEKHYRHFNAASLVDAARAYREHMDRGGQMFLSLAGAMSTAELGISLADMIREGKVHAISCTGANLEEDLFNLVAHDHYERVPHYRDLTPAEEVVLLERGMNRVTDTCIPEEEAMRKIERVLIERWQGAQEQGVRKLPHRFLYDLLLDGTFKDSYQVDASHSWLLAAAEKDLPLFVPGWEDSTLGNVFAAQCLKGNLENDAVIRPGSDYMMELVAWYRRASQEASIGFFQIGGGIAGDFAICVVPLITQDMNEDAKPWGYYCQISDSTTSYGSYSGAVPNEKITWGKMSVESPKFIIESDATIVAPLVFAYVLGW